jgi:hypothetical protein
MMSRVHEDSVGVVGGVGRDGDVPDVCRWQRLKGQVVPGG